METCSLCNGLKYVINGDSATPCSCLKLEQERKFYEIAVNQANLPRIKRFDIDGYVGTKSVDNLPKVKQFVMKFKEKFYNQSMYWFGANSTQKTTMACWVADYLLKHKVKVRYVRMHDLLNTLMEVEFLKNSDRIEAEITPFLDTDFLIVDEAFDKSKVAVYKSGYHISFLDSFFRTRMETNVKSTLLISNCSVDSIEENFGVSLKELIKRNTVGAVLEWQDVNIPDYSITTSIWD